MAAKTSKISVALSANAKEFKKELGKAEQDVGKFSKGASKAFSALKGAGIGIAVGLGAAFVKAGLDFEEMENILIKGTGATGDALEDLKTQTSDVLRTVPETAEVVAGAIADVNTFFGATGDQLEDTTGLFLDFARVTDMDVGDAIARLDAQMTQFNIPLEESDELLGDLVRISQATGAPMDNLLGQMEKFGPIFATASFSGEETAAMFGMLEQAGVDVTKLGPSLEKFFGDVAEAGGDPRQAFEDMVEQIANADTETQALALASEAFGTAGARMTSAIRDGGLELETFGGLLGDGVGLVGEQAAATETLSDKFAILKNDLMTRLGPAAAATMEAMVVAIDAVIVAIEESVAAIQRFAGWFDENLMPIITPIISLVVAWVQYMWKQIQNVVDLVVALFTGDFGGAWDALKAMATTAIDFIVETFKDLPKLLWDSMIAGARWILSAGKSIGLNLLKGIGDALGSAVDWAAAFAKDIANALIGFVNMAIDDLNNLLEFKIEGPGFLPDIHINPPDIPGIPLLAEGGIVDKPGGMLALIGEAGPEAVIPLDRAGGGMGGAPMTVNIYMPVGSDGDSVVRALQEYEARNGPVPVGTRSL
jgi:hypothetical protein